MGLFFRKRIKLSKLLNLNLSKSGFGFSFGVKGLRISENKNGVYLNAGRNGLYFRKKITSSNNESRSACDKIEAVEVPEIEQSENKFNNKFAACLILMVASVCLMLFNAAWFILFLGSLVCLIRLQINKKKIIESDKSERLERQRQSKYKNYNYSYEHIGNKNNDNK